MSIATPTRPTEYFRKYPNRRLYSLSANGYVTFTEIVQTIREGKHVVIRERETNGRGQRTDGVDVTDFVLLQAIREDPQLFVALIRQIDLQDLIRSATP